MKKLSSPPNAHHMHHEAIDKGKELMLGKKPTVYARNLAELASALNKEGAAKPAPKSRKF
jgi:hypothetical protein